MLIKRALIATNLIAQGTPMLCGGDELGHTQHGNNNPYCQDNPTTWINWSRADHGLIAFTAHVLRLRQQYAPLGHVWLTERDITWFLPNGRAPQASDWNHPNDGALGCRIAQARASLVLLFNPASDYCYFALATGAWNVLLDTRYDEGLVPAGNSPVQSGYVLHGYSLALLELRNTQEHSKEYTR